ncbi:trehalose-6-phosphate synthase [Micromonospora sp. NPDC000442]|uniref:trehalose-6-phosphate synthase n=1 Tax=Micromonospora sp. NPDC000442 TaxID=3364217 RepID=UPI00367E3B39
MAAEHPDGLEVQLPSGGGVTIRLLRHDQETFGVVQDFVTAELLWAANNYGWDRWTTPTFTERTYTAMDHFAAFNKDFSTALLDASDKVADPVYLVHDYQLLGVPALLRERRPDAPVLLFVHIPWPSPDYWRVLQLPRLRRRPAARRQGRPGRRGGAMARQPMRGADNAPRLQSAHLRGRQPRLPDGVAEWVGNDPLVVHAGRTDPAKNAERAVRAFLRAVRSDQRLAAAPTPPPNWSSTPPAAPAKRSRPRPARTGPTAAPKPAPRHRRNRKQVLRPRRSASRPRSRRSHPDKPASRPLPGPHPHRTHVTPTVHMAGQHKGPDPRSGRPGLL